MQLILLFFIGALVCAIAGRLYPRQAGWLGVAVCLAGAAMAMRLLLDQTIGISTLVDTWLGEQPLEVTFYFDSLSTLVATVVATTGLVAALATQGKGDYHTVPMLLLALSAGVGAVLAGEIPTFYAFSLLLSLCLALALALKGQRRSAAQFFMTVEGASVLFMLAAMYIAIGSGSSRFSELVSNTNVAFLPAGAWAFAGIALAIVARSAWVPLHSWLTRASRGLSAASDTWILVLPPLVGLYLLLRAWPWVVRLDVEWSISLLQWLGAATVLLGSYAALHQRSLRRVAAFVVLAQAGLVPLGLGTSVTQGSDAAVYQLVSFGLMAPLTFLALGRLSDAFRDQQPQEPISFTLAMMGVAAGIAAPTTISFPGRIALMQAFLATPGDSLPFLLVYWAGTAFSTLALLGVVHRLVQRGVSLGETQGPSENVLFQPAVLALALPAVVGLLLGLSSSFWEDTISAAASGISMLSADITFTPRGAAWAVLMTLAGPALGMVLYLANRGCATWRWKLLGIHQCPVVAPEGWWSYLERADPYQAVRLLLLGAVDDTANVLDFVVGRLSR
ncbi:MAG: hypothetical protein M1370_04465 [Bacteroidetes bacterium]|nr:hypothetical protein [Bacteroidota bacterium]MCL5027192.1 hypothetical protein [Chloroflexota bacterium]